MAVLASSEEKPIQRIFSEKLEEKNQCSKTKRLGLIYNPPTLLVEYSVFCSKVKKRTNRHKKIKIRIRDDYTSTIEIDSTAVALALLKKYSHHFGGVKCQQLSRLIKNLLKSSLAQLDIKVEENDKREDQNVLSHADHSSEKIILKEKRYIKPKLDMSIDESQTKPLSSDDKIVVQHHISPVLSPTVSYAMKKNEAVIVSAMDKSHLESIGNLNKCSEKDLEKAKDQMDIQFLKTRLQPGDEGYIYDKEVIFPSNDLDSSWD